MATTYVCHVSITAILFTLFPWLQVGFTLFPWLLFAFILVPWLHCFDFMTITCLHLVFVATVCVAATCVYFVSMATLVFTLFTWLQVVLTFYSCVYLFVEESLVL